MSGCERVFRYQRRDRRQSLLGWPRVQLVGEGGWNRGLEEHRAQTHVRSEGFLGKAGQPYPDGQKPRH